MTRTIHLDFERFKRLPARPDVWQLAAVRMPQWVVEKERPPFRPLVPLCHSAAADRLGMGEMQEPGEAVERAALGAIINLSRVKDVQYRPTRVEVRDPELAGALRPVLDEAGIELGLCERLGAIDEVMAEMTRRFAGPAGTESLFAGPGVDLERVRAFAAAAAEFYRAAPWNQLTDEDLLRVESPVPDEGLRFFTALGGGGGERGIGFYRSERDFQRLLTDETPAQFMAGTRLWLLSFDPVYDLPIPDSELWETQSLPLAEERAYPSLYCIESPVTRQPPDAAALAFAEGLARALATTTEDELDSGRWSKSVATCEGERTIALSIPALLEPAAKTRQPRRGESQPLPDRRLMERALADLQSALSDREFKDVGEINAFLASTGGKIPPRAPDSSPQGRAQELIYEALEVRGRLRLKLAREALKVHPDCADAWGLLAEEMPELARRADLYGKAVEAAERTLGSGPLQEHVGHFWGVLETRPYMRARFGQAECLWSAGRRDEALDHLKDLLRLNPNDNQGVRDVLLPRLLEMGRDDEAAQVLAAYEEDGSAIMEYARALLEFRRSGDGEASRGKLEAAVRSNAHVPKHLLDGPRPGGPLPEQYRMGGEEEAILAAVALSKPWAGTAGAMDWLRESRKRAKKAREEKRRKTRGTKR